jgi:hypothetical protein
MMSAGNIIVYPIAAALVIAALARRSYSMKARGIKGNIVQGRDISGTVNQTYTEAADAKEAGPDRVAWAIGIVGVLVAVAQLAHDVFWAK